MKRITTLLTLALALTGYQIVNQNEKDISFTPTESEVVVAAETSESNNASSSSEESGSAGSQEANTDESRTGVFNEKEVTPTDLPETTLGWEADYSELDAAIEDYYEHELDEEEKEANAEPVPEEDMQSLNSSLDNNDILAPLGAQADQVIIEIGDRENYVTRIVVPMTYQEAEDVLSGQDILLLNEALTHIGDRLVLVNYYDEETDTMIPMHLANTANAIFFNERVAEDQVQE